MTRQLSNTANYICLRESSVYHDTLKNSKEIILKVVQATRYIKFMLF